MSKETKLWKFLKREVRLSRITREQGYRETIPPSAHPPQTVVRDRPKILQNSSIMHILADASASLCTSELISINDSALDRIFGDTEAPTRCMQEIKQAKIEQLLANKPALAKHEQGDQDQRARNSELQRLKEELGEIITSKQHIEQKGAERRRQLLICQIRCIEAEEHLQERQKLKRIRCGPLPESLSASEKRNMFKAYQRASLAVAGLEQGERKRNREQSEHDLDGEERLRLGKRSKGPTMEVTGHWRADVCGRYAASRQGW